MTKVNASFGLARQWELLSLIPSKGPGITAFELTERLGSLGFNVSKRTVERDLIELSRLFGIECNDKSRPYGWKWMNGASANLPSMDIADAVSLYFVESHLRFLLPESVLRSLESKFVEAKNKRSELKKHSPIGSWEDKVIVRHPTLPIIPPEVPGEVLEKVQTALMYDLKMSLLYKSQGVEAAQEIELNPLGLIQRGSIIYLVATAYDYVDVRLYALHRIFEATILESKSNRPKGFNLKEYVDKGAIEFGGGESIKLVARVNSVLADLLMETPISKDMKISGDAEFKTLSATVVDSWQLKWWILSQGSQIEVIAPKNLRKEIASELRSSLLLYGDK